MKTVTVRLPDAIAAAIEPSRGLRGVSKSDIVRERFADGRPPAQEPGSPAYAIADLIGAAGGLPADLSARTKYYLRASGYGRKRSR